MKLLVNQPGPKRLISLKYFFVVVYYERKMINSVSSLFSGDLLILAGSTEKLSRNHWLKMFLRTCRMQF